MKLRGRAIVALLYERDGNRCYLCGEYVNRRVATVDHIRPYARGGSNIPANWALTHHRCNQLKGDLPIEEFRQVVARIHAHLNKA